MKKSKNRALLVLSTFVALSLASCSGLTPGASSILSGSGSEGSVSVDSSFDGDARIREIYDLYVKKVLGEGETPSSYEEWLESIKGKDGTTFLFDQTDPAEDIGNVGDVYLNTSNWDVYVKSTEGWTKVGNILGGQGIQGPQGETGEKGDPGVQGEKGDKGEPGNTPYIGDNGHWWIGDQDTGIPATGAQGEQGEKGDKGKTGAQGPQGDKGETGAQGPQGEKGDKGDKGETGAQGPQGEKGDKGDKGETGADGQTPYIGQNGNWWIGDVDTQVPATGSQGEQGKSGENGLTPYIGQNGNWWIGDEDTGVSATGTQGEKGDKGDKGDTGADGQTPHIGANGNWWIGDKDTGIKAEGSDGAQGEKGDTGAQGQTGKQGEQGADGRTAWSNTILPSVGGYVTVNYGSAYVGEPITFMAFPNNDYELADITLNGNSYAEMIDWSNNSLTVPMVEHGYVVSATFNSNDKPELYKVNFYGVVDHGEGVSWERVGYYWIEAGSTLVDYANDMASMVVQHYEDRYYASTFQGWDTDVSMPVYGDLDIRALYYSSEKELITNHEFYGTEHEGNLDDPFDNEDAILVAKNLDSGDRGRNFVIEGTIDTFYNGPESRSDFQYSFYLTPEVEGGERFEAYNAYRVNEYGDRYELGFEDLFHGAHVVFEGPLTVYTYYTPFSGFYQATALYGDYYEKLDNELIFHCAFPDGDDAFNGQTSFIASWIAHGDYASYFQENGFQATLGAMYGVEFSEGLCDALEGKTLAEIKSDKELFAFWNGLISWWQAEKGGILDFFVAYSDRLPYQNVQCETKSALIHSVEGTLPTRAEHEATVAEAIAVAANMKVGDTTEDIYTITGYVVKRERGRYGEYLYYISDTKDIAAEDINAMNCFILDPYQIPDEDMLAALSLGAKISYRDHIRNYSGRAQSNRYFLDGANLTILEAGEASPNVIEGIEIYDKGGSRVESINIPLGSSTLFDIALYPEGSDINGLNWNVSGSAVSVKISASGQMRVEGNELGDATIEFRNENGEIIGKFSVYVYDVPVSEYATQIWSATWNMKAYVGETKQLMAIPWPFDSRFGELTFVSSDESVATVDAYGMVTAIAPGEVQIIVSDLATGLTANMNVTVLEYPDNYLEPFEKVYYANSIQSDPEYVEILAEYGIEIDEILEFHLDGTFEMYDRDGMEYRQSGRYYRTESSIILDFNNIRSYRADYPYYDYICDLWHEIFFDAGGGLYDESQVEPSEGEIVPFRYVYSEASFVEADVSACSIFNAMVEGAGEGETYSFYLSEDLTLAKYTWTDGEHTSSGIAALTHIRDDLYFFDGPNTIVSVDLEGRKISDPDISGANILAVGTIYGTPVTMYDNGFFTINSTSYGQPVTMFGTWELAEDGKSYNLNGGGDIITVTITPGEEGQPGTFEYGSVTPIPPKTYDFELTDASSFDITADGAIFALYYWGQDSEGGYYTDFKELGYYVDEGDGSVHFTFELPTTFEGFMILRINGATFHGFDDFNWEEQVWNQTQEFYNGKLSSSTFEILFLSRN